VGEVGRDVRSVRRIGGGHRVQLSGPTCQPDPYRLAAGRRQSNPATVYSSAAFPDRRLSHRNFVADADPCANADPSANANSHASVAPDHKRRLLYPALLVAGLSAGAFHRQARP
jgi:hypothetical protein